MRRFLPQQEGDERFEMEVFSLHICMYIDKSFSGMAGLWCRELAFLAFLCLWDLIGGLLTTA